MARADRRALIAQSALSPQASNTGRVVVVVIVVVEADAVSPASPPHPAASATASTADSRRKVTGAKIGDCGGRAGLLQSEEMADKSSTPAPSGPSADGLMHFTRPSSGQALPPPPPAKITGGHIDKAAWELRGLEFVRRCNEQMERLRQDPEAWDDYWAEAALVLTADDID